MINEIELKLAVTPEAFNVLEQHLQQFNPLERKSIFLGNTYYDYPDHVFAKQKMGLRIRQEDQHFTLTLKTNGQVVGGLHTRPEYHLLIDGNNVPTNDQLRALYPFEQLPTSPLKLIFSTDFNRTFWLVKFRNSKIEVAFDQGEIVSGKRSQPICEIEFELKEGEIEDLFYFVEELPILTNIYFSSASKAKRGYQLAQPYVLTDWLDQWRDFLQAEQEKGTKAQATFHRLLKMEQALVEETFALPSSLFSQDFMKTVERVGAFFNLYHYYDENKKLFEVMAESKSDNLREYDLLPKLLKSNQHFFDQIQNLIRFHSETKDNKKTIEKLTALFSTRLYVERMINLMRLAILGEANQYH
ncbi:CYTH domain-containing protein [Rodentibacter trehalosifermentans]|uniref:CYTH domain-containing protein n=1 Tax=Rodentibacter trehalosifermentans TaxID=1908263 RepID=A0A1V3IY70_9PAST|nr:inorganic triphosphatase [Rodentibacter trehalosifermentans]OOF47135.1 CYTH domain-containing protein [Rodentibacter trehalosifermentans]